MLRRLISEYQTPSDGTVIIGASYGFDAAAIDVGGETIVVKSDPITFATSDAARYLVAVNANDIACMGAIPRWMTAVALLPENHTTPELVESLFADLQEACVAEGIMLIGGHTEVTIGVDRPLLIGTLLGAIGVHGLLQPGQASEGDELYVTKSIALEGTALLATELFEKLVDTIPVESLRKAQALLHDPGVSVTRDARLALSSGAVTALHDTTEGGIATAVHEIAEASGLGARIDGGAIPVLRQTREICNHLGLDPLGLLSSGALLVAANPGSAATLKNAFAGSGIPIAQIGILTRKSDGITIIRSGEASVLPRFDADELARALTS